jgi:sugar/nucleoside kinase (ribokinase family)
MTRPLAVVGNVNVDLILGPAEPWPQPGTEVIVAHDDLRVGGAAGNASLAWTGLGAAHQVAANVGSDVFGTWLRDGFGALAAGWTVEPSATTVSVGITHPNGERTFFTSQGHLPALSFPAVRGMLDSERLRGGILLLCGAFLTDRLTADYHALFDWAEAHGIDVALDTGWPLAGWTDAVLSASRAWLPRCRYLLLNEIEISALAGTADHEAAAAALAPLLHPDATIVTKLGPRGAVAFFRGEPVVAVAAPQVAVVDTIGAGDVFNAGFLDALARDRPLAEAVEAGVAAASAAISATGPRYAFGDRT